MFGLFGRKRKKREAAKDPATVDTFREATGGGWGEPADVIPGDGGAHADYVGRMLERAREQALASGVAVGQSFEFTLTEIPRGISDPNEIVFGLIMRAREAGLSPGVMKNETIKFTRIR